MNSFWIQIGTAILLPFFALLAGFLTGRRSRSIAVATTVEKDWLDTVAADLAEFIEVQYDIIWKRWRLRDLELTEPNARTRLYDKESFRDLQDAVWKQTFRSDLLKTKLCLMLDDDDPLQAELIRLLEQYALYADRQDREYQKADQAMIEKIANDLGQLLRVEHKPAIIAAGRRVLEAKREAIRKSV